MLANSLSNVISGCVKNPHYALKCTAGPTFMGFVIAEFFLNKYIKQTIMYYVKMYYTFF